VISARKSAGSWGDAGEPGPTSRQPGSSGWEGPRQLVGLACLEARAREAAAQALQYLGRPAMVGRGYRSAAALEPVYRLVTAAVRACSWATAVGPAYR
jgi:hypothetical protein